VQSRDLLARAAYGVHDGDVRQRRDRAHPKLSEKEKDEEAQKSAISTRATLASANREVIESQFRQRWTSEFQKGAPTRPKKIGGEPLGHQPRRPLALVAEGRSERGPLKFNDNVGESLKAPLRGKSWARSTSAWAVPARRRGAFESDDNPFGPADHLRRVQAGVPEDGRGRSRSAWCS